MRFFFSKVDPVVFGEDDRYLSSLPKMTSTYRRTWDPVSSAACGMVERRNCLTRCTREWREKYGGTRTAERKMKRTIVRKTNLLD